jgi:hypothetical protein
MLNREWMPLIKPGVVPCDCSASILMSGIAVDAYL